MALGAGVNMEWIRGLIRTGKMFFFVCLFGLMSFGKNNLRIYGIKLLPYVVVITFIATCKYIEV